MGLLIFIFSLMELYIDAIYEPEINRILFIFIGNLFIITII